MAKQQSSPPAQPLTAYPAISDPCLGVFDVQQTTAQHEEPRVADVTGVLEDGGEQGARGVPVWRRRWHRHVEAGAGD